MGRKKIEQHEFEEEEDLNVEPDSLPGDDSTLPHNYVMDEMIAEAAEDEDKPKKHKPRGNLNGQPPKPISYSAVRGFASLGLTVEEISACLGISDNLFYRKQKQDPLFREAVTKGRALRVARMASIVTAIAETNGVEPSTRLRAAEIYLKRHGQGWKDEKVQIEHSGDIEVKTTLGDEALLRAAKTFVQLRSEDES